MVCNFFTASDRHLTKICIVVHGFPNYRFPGKNRRINLVSNLSDVQAVRVEISDGVNPRRVVYVRCKAGGTLRTSTRRPLHLLLPLCSA